MIEDEKINVAIDLNDISRQVAQQCVSVGKDKRKLTFKEIDEISNMIVSNMDENIKLYKANPNKINKDYFVSDLLSMALSYAYYNNINMNKFLKISLKD